jgi:hypothetical protein
MKKIVAKPWQYINYIPHFPELNEEKLGKFLKAKTVRRKIRQALTGSHVAADVLTPPPVLCCPHEETLFILNGKHRLTMAALLDGLAVEVVIPETVSDIEHGLSPKWLGGMTVENVCDLFMNKQSYIDLCKDHGVLNLMNLMFKEREKIERVFGPDSEKMRLVETGNNPNFTWNVIVRASQIAKRTSG